MTFDLDQRTASLSIGEFAAFTIGPREPSDHTGPQGLWRARLGTRWHQELRATASVATPATTFEVPLTGQVFHGGWTLTLTGRIDQFLPAAGNNHAVLREIKTTLDPIPAPEEDLRAAHPEYFAQLASYLALRRIADPTEKIRGELVFVEAGSGLSQTIVFTANDEAPFRVQLERVAEFLNLRLKARERLRHLDYRAAFADLREGQQTTQADLAAALAAQRHVLFTAPTGFGKTGALLECALEAMKSGRYSRLLYLTSKATGQLQVIRTLQAMTQPSAKCPPLGDTLTDNRGLISKPQCHLIGDTVVEKTDAKTPIALWHVRPKHEHCLTPKCFCDRRELNHPASVAQRWAQAGLAHFYLFEDSARDLPTLRTAGRSAQICPYEITRTSLAFQDVWVGDYNYVFAPANRTLFYNQPGFNPAETLLIIDEAHNLPSRAADARSHTLLADDTRRVLSELDHGRAPAPLIRDWETWTLLLTSIEPCEALDLDLEDDIADALRRLADTLTLHPPGIDDLERPVRDLLWQIPVLAEWFNAPFPKLVWSPRAGELRLTCLDAALPTGEILNEYAGVVFATATPGPATTFAEACGLADPSPKLLATSSKLQALSSKLPAPSSQLPANSSKLLAVSAKTPWRDAAYEIAYDVRVDTTYQQRARHAGTTADTIAALHAASEKSAQLSAPRSQPGPGSAVAVFFPSYAYAEAIEQTLNRSHPYLRVALQPRLSDLAAQTAWVDESLAFTDALFLVLGSSFAEGIDTLGGRISHAMVVGPALPEVNAVQKARLAALTGYSRESAFQRVYQVPGIQKVNQALGRLVRAPGQRAKVILQCRRFLEPAYAALLDRDYQFGATLSTDTELARWLG
ncbi:MAG: helicase [Opitutus sp.]|nr:helicase [Opitutus sp.]MCS6248150.1 helicase [Opitutus sp.]MCS6274572.1 helicase [Opitutus sp.]MCS6277103.1 helicase [Opitutus sp.]MCS6300225.1 helicase [Opitutus sp.]